MSSLELPSSPLTRRNAIRGAAALFGAGALTTLASAPASAQEGVFTGYRTLPWSKKGIYVALGRGGSGKRYLIAPGKWCLWDVNSFYVQFVQGSGYQTRINGKEYTRTGWYDCAWWFKVEGNVQYDDDVV